MRNRYILLVLWYAEDRKQITQIKQMRFQQKQTAELVREKFDESENVVIYLFKD